MVEFWLIVGLISVGGFLIGRHLSSSRAEHPLAAAGGCQAGNADFPDATMWVGDLWADDARFQRELDTRTMAREQRQSDLANFVRDAFAVADRRMMEAAPNAGLAGMARLREGHKQARREVLLMAIGLFGKEAVELHLQRAYGQWLSVDYGLTCLDYGLANATR